MISPDPHEQMADQKIGFIGAGQMARALAGGFLKAGLVEGRGLWASDPVVQACTAFGEAAPGAHTGKDNRHVAEAADVLFLAVKPQHMPAALEELKDVVAERHLVVSIAAGVKLATIGDWFLPGVRLVRVMPNTPCLIGQSASGFCRGPGATDEDMALVEKLLSAVGRAFPMEEKLLDAVTGLAGSGPAFVYVMIEALADGGVLAGLPREVAAALAAQTVRGAAEMLQVSREHPAVLKDRVASPGGTTIAGLAALEANGFRAALIAAVEQATKRSIELGQTS